MGRATKIFRGMLPWLELSVHLIFPIGVGVILLYTKVYGGTRLTTDTLVGLTFALVAGVAVSRTLERYVTLKDIQEETRKLAEMSNLDLLRSAQKCGVVNLFPRTDMDSINSVVDLIKNADGTLDFCGVAFPSMTRDESFRDTVVEYSKRHDVRVMLLKPDSDEAARRALIEAPLGRLTINDIVATTEWIQAQQIENKRFRLHYYDLPPMLSLIITDKFLQVEPYHFGRPEGLEGCIGGHVPMMKIRNLTELPSRKNPWSFFKAHYDYMWEYTRGFRVNLPISMVKAKPSTYVILRNEMQQNISTDGWKITGQASRRPYEFALGSTWKGGEQIAIFQSLDVFPSAQEMLKAEGIGVGQMLEAEGDFMGSNTILRLTNSAGTLVGEWSLPVSPQDLPT